MLRTSEALRVLILCCISLSDSLGYNLLVNVLPVLSDRSDPLHYIGADNLSSGFAYSIFQFTFCFGVAVFPPFVGRWSDQVGRRPMLLISLSILSLSYFVQGLSSSFWMFTGARILSGVSGCLRPLAIAYIADMVTEDCLRSKLITSLSLLTAFAVGFGPALGAHLLGLNRGYPFVFMSGITAFCFVLTFFLLPEIKNARVSLSVPVTPRSSKSRKPNKFRWSYRYLLTLGFSTYFMAMAAASSFPLSLKEQFKLDPFHAGLCSLMDGPLIFLSNFFFMHYLTTLSSGCKASILAAASFGLIALVPTAIEAEALIPFLLLKYTTSIGGPIVFSAIAQTMMGVCPQNVCGSYAGLLTFFHGAGRLFATAIVGPLFHFNSAYVYYAVAWVGVVSAILFVVLYRDLLRTLGMLSLKTPLLTPRDDEAFGPSPPLSRSLSLLYPGTPAEGNVNILARD
jgi:MFS family permease